MPSIIIEFVTAITGDAAHEKEVIKFFEKIKPILLKM